MRDARVGIAMSSFRLYATLEASLQASLLTDGDIDGR
jgi:hypothetical protein